MKEEERKTKIKTASIGCILCRCSGPYEYSDRTRTVQTVWCYSVRIRSDLSDFHSVLFDKTKIEMIVLKYFKTKRKQFHDNVSFHAPVNLISSRKSKFNVQFISEIITDICLQYTLRSVLKCCDKGFHSTFYNIFYQRVCILPMPIFYILHLV